MFVLRCRHSLMEATAGAESVEVIAHADCLEFNPPMIVFMAALPTTFGSGCFKSEKLVLDYLVKQNRPYSTTDIVGNLHGAVTKIECQRAVNSLVEKDLVTAKLYGKQAIYVVRQDSIDAATPEELAAVDKQLAELQSKIAESKSRNKQLSSSRV
ncbi:hypothetical protein BGZ54_000752 [Gamsiella multidivaricata]|nr:hypothetical protein BGZ54_000752 [Gamsiella multidivaricata]